MAGMFSSALLEDIRSRVDIVDVVGQFVTLRKTAGSNWKGLCPFHSEKTPSFNVNPAKGIFHCFGCGAGGDVFTFLMRQDRSTFPDTVRLLARRAGVDLPDERGDAQGGERERLRRVMERATAFYEDQLWGGGGARARDYLAGRGVDPEVARRFRLGYAPDAWDTVIGFMRAEGITPDEVEKAGLAVPRPSGTGYYDRFRARLLFPIRDLHGQVVAFGGRSLGDEQPKYLNSPETLLYSKGQMLYAMDLARDAVRVKNRAVLVEGYVDCLMAHQNGFTETVAVLGTAFTPAQLALLRRHCQEVVTFFDADAAGQKAAERAEALLEPSREGIAWSVTRTGGFGEGSRFQVKVALLPAGQDPDTLLRGEGAEAFERCLASARGLLSYALDRTLSASGDPASPKGRTSAFARVATLLAKVSDADEAAALSREAAIRLGVDAAQLWIEAQRLRVAPPRPLALAPAASGSSIPLAERELVWLLVHVPESREVLLPVVDESHLSDPVRLIVAALRGPDATPPASLLADLPGDVERGLLSGVLMDERSVDEVGVIVEQFRTRFEVKRRLRRIREVSRGIAEGQASGDLPLGGLQAGLARLQQEVAEARRLTVSKPSAGRQPVRPAGPQGVSTNG